MRIAVIGGGAAGLAAAWSVSSRHETVLFEAAAALGGHAHTIEVPVAGRDVPVDTGFIVYNEPNYPDFTRLLDRLGVATQASDMSFSVSLGGGRREYAGTPVGLFSQPANLVRPAHWRMALDIARFYREAPRCLDGDTESRSLGAFLREGRYSDAFIHDHLLPMAAAIWSSTPERMRLFPVRSFVRFFANHGLLGVRGRPQWRTVRGGSRRYVQRLVEDGRFAVRVATPVHAVVRSAGSALVVSGPGDTEAFDHVVFATPADRTLAILGAAARPDERRLLGRFRYQPNRAVVHGDRNLLPRRRRLWASWNYMAEGGRRGRDRAAISYGMNRLQSLPGRSPVIVTLNPIREPAAGTVFADLAYRHPQFDDATLAAQAAMPAIQGIGRTWFCGSYCGYGFHEDAIRSGLDVAAALGAPVPWRAAPPPAGALKAAAE